MGEQDISAQSKKDLSKLVTQDEAKFLADRDKQTPTSLLYQVSQMPILEAACTKRLAGITTPHFEAQERMAAMRFAERQAGSSGRSNWNFCSSPDELAMVNSNPNLGHGDRSWASGGYRRLR